MKKIIPIAFAALLCLPLHAQERIQLSIGAVARQITEINLAPNQSSLHLVLEGAGRMALNGEAVHFHAQCAVTDTVLDKKIIAGAGDCEFKSAAGGAVAVHFQTLPGSGERGHFHFSGGTRDFTRFNGKAAIEVTVNPTRVGKPVFFVEDRSEAP